MPNAKRRKSTTSPKAQREIPAKCLICANLTMPEVHARHGQDGTSDRCYDPSVCRSRRSYARHADRRNHARRMQRYDDQQSEQNQFPNPLPVPQALLTDAYYAVLVTYREPWHNGRVHAIGAQVWQRSTLVNQVPVEHLMGVTPSHAFEYVSEMLKLLHDCYGIKKFATEEILDPDYCPCPTCPRRTAMLRQTLGGKP